MRLFWRTYCYKCGLHLKKEWWIITEPCTSGQGRCKCPRCDTLMEKFDTIEEGAMGRKCKKVGYKDECE